MEAEREREQAERFERAWANYERKLAERERAA